MHAKVVNRVCHVIGNRRDTARPLAKCRKRLPSLSSRREAGRLLLDGRRSAEQSRQIAVCPADRSHLGAGCRGKFTDSHRRTRRSPRHHSRTDGHHPLSRPSGRGPRASWPSAAGSPGCASANAGRKSPSGTPRRQRRACLRPRCLWQVLWPRSTCAPEASPRRCRVQPCASTRSAGIGMRVRPSLSPDQR